MRTLAMVQTLWGARGHIWHITFSFWPHWSNYLTCRFIFRSHHPCLPPNMIIKSQPLFPSSLSPKTFLICSSWFARVVKGGDLRSPALKCAWVQTPQPTYWLYSLVNVLNFGVKPQNQIVNYIHYYILWIRRVLIDFRIHILIVRLSSTFVR